MNLNQSDRVRARNFTNGEVTLLLHLVGKYSGILECKSNRALTNKQKNEAWEKLANEFNSTLQLVEGYRSAQTLKGKWGNIKKVVKKNEENSGAAGGRVEAMTREILDNCESEPLELDAVKPEEAEGSDAASEARPSCVEPLEVAAVKPERGEDAASEASPNYVERAGVSTAMQKMCDVAEDKLMLIEFKREHRQMAHKRKMEILELEKELLRAKIRFQSEEHEFRITCMREAHQARITAMKIGCLRNS